MTVLARSTALLLALMLPTGCGSGLAGALSSGGSSGSSSNAPTSTSGLAVVDPGTGGAPKTSPAEIRFVLTDAEGDAASVAFTYEVAGGAPRPVTQLDTSVNLAALPSSGTGVEYALPWRFVDEGDARLDGTFVDNVVLRAFVNGAEQPNPPGANGGLGLGNDLPTVALEPPPFGESEGIVPVRFTVADTSSDNVGIRVEYLIDGDDPETGWQLARPGGLPLATPTPELAFESVEAPAGGVDLVFFWDTNVDLNNEDDDVRLRFTAVDPVGDGEAAVSDLLRIDNNDPPSVSLRFDQVLAAPDEVRGIPVPFTVTDPENDPVRVVMQWRRAGQGFPELPSMPEALDAILNDPKQREVFQICSEFPRADQWRAVPIDATSVQLDPVVRPGLPQRITGTEGRLLQVLRPPGRLERIVDEWLTQPLTNPVATLPTGSGHRAFVLDQHETGSWRLTELDLATGAVLRTLGTGVGTPTAMVADGADAVLIATALADVWRVGRLPLDGDSQRIEPLVEADGSTAAGPIRGLARLGSAASLITVGDSIVRVAYAPGAPSSQVTLFDGLVAPGGMVIDPVHLSTVLVAEGTGDFGRVLSFDLHTGSVRPICSELALPGRPRSLALDETGVHLLILSDVDEGGVALVDVVWRTGCDSVDVLHRVSSALTSIATGPSGLRLLTASDGALYAARGVEQERVIVEADTASNVALVDEPFDPALRPDRALRLGASAYYRNGSHTFPWDSRDAGSGNVFLRATPYDSERGLSDQGTAAKTVRMAGFEVTDFGFAQDVRSIAVADLNQDGRLDLVSADVDSNSLTIYTQNSSGDFDFGQALGDERTTPTPRSVAAGDLDQDGDIDLVSANRTGDSLTIFRQIDPDTFSSPEPLGTGDTLERPFDVIVADLNQDGQLDIASANAQSQNVTIFYQESGVFSDAPSLSLGVPPFVSQPKALASGDLDNDGDIDLAVATDSNDLLVYFQSQRGTFSAASTISAPDDLGFVRSIAVADLDQDGDSDIVCGNETREWLTLYFQEARTFRSAQVLVSRPRSVTTADLNLDGAIDIVCGTGSQVTTFYQSAPGQFDRVEIENDIDPFRAGIAADDFTGDGSVEIVLSTVTAQGRGRPFARLSPRSLGSSPESVFNFTWDGSFSNSVAVAHFDFDGDWDVAHGLTCPGADGEIRGAISIHLQESPRVFSKEGIRTELEYPTGYISAGDINNDSFVDIVCTQPDGIHTFLRSAFGDVARGPVLTTPTGVPRIVLLADLERDGDLDVVSLNTGQVRAVHVFLNESPPFGPAAGFREPQVLFGDFSATSDMAVLDIGADGDLDLLLNVDTANGRLLVTIEMETPGVYGTQLVTVAESDCCFWRSFEVADVDLDGDDDFVAGQNGGSVFLFLQEGSGLFSETTLPFTLTGGATFSFTGLGDTDQDGLVDLLTNDIPSGQGFRQVHPGSFSARATRIPGLGTSDIPHAIIEDIDGDGEVDIATDRGRIIWAGPE